MTEQLLAWHPRTGLAPDTDPEPPRLLAADSWLVCDGTARGLGRHRDRFLAGCAAAGADVDEVAEFWPATLAQLPRHGAWFPRVELVAGSPYPRLRLRPAPRRTDRARVWATAPPDPRHAPRRKGPDLEALAALRAAAAELDAQEALLTCPDGLVLEAANASLLWWEGDVLCVPDPELPVLPGVTTTLLQEEAVRRGIDVRPRRCRLAELAGREVWVANALHGIRPVVEWVGAAVPVGTPARAAGWRRWWESCAEPLPG
ncbi:hypothetical protein GCM10012275_33600 [Longimycelium tulufanense]|uniref:Aminotransferase class IV n=1 Tax=Longimycelium tulufanense TaxID=907463 RepID=A0A8J3CCP2_9PSEU|nr:aminotransferase class IV [Longimycelium tulufanense]GGM59779.1 hypothetical protein GCM10012275_33600 [Longimycelium tulufanense]